jgi:hypothetical protein
MDLEQAQPIEEERGPGPAAPRYRWHHKLLALLGAAIAFEVGIFLIVFPWMDPWPNNYFATVVPEWRRFWVSPYVRGAVSGLGLVNVVIALSEVFRLRRFSA